MLNKIKKKFNIKKRRKKRLSDTYGTWHPQSYHDQRMEPKEIVLKTPLQHTLNTLSHVNHHLSRVDQSFL